MSVTMEDKVEKKKGRRVTKNSSGLTTRSEETPLGESIEEVPERAKKAREEES